MGTANGRKSIFITGAASGMGRETARLFREKGWFIGGYDVHADGLRAQEKELGADNCVVRQLDDTVSQLKCTKNPELTRQLLSQMRRLLSELDSVVAELTPDLRWKQDG